MVSLDLRFAMRGLLAAFLSALFAALLATALAALVLPADCGPLNHQLVTLAFRHVVLLLKRKWLKPLLDLSHHQFHGGLIVNLYTARDITDGETLSIQIHARVSR